jgi:hypothetical protein
MAASLEANADDNTPRQVRHLKEQADRVNLTATRYNGSLLLVGIEVETLSTEQPLKQLL